jgi:hypothetical protein
MNKIKLVFFCMATIFTFFLCSSVGQEKNKKQTKKPLKVTRILVEEMEPGTLIKSLPIQHTSKKKSHNIKEKKTKKK